MPVTMPGSAIGSTSSTVMLSLPRKLLRAMPSAVSEPRTIASNVATAATDSDSRIAAQISARANAASNQCSVRPGGGNSYVRSSVVNAYKHDDEHRQVHEREPGVRGERAQRATVRFQRV